MRFGKYAFFAMLVPSFAFAEPEVGPLPRVVESSVRIEPMKGGYQIILSRQATESLRNGLAVVNDGKPYTAFAKLAIKELNDPEIEKHFDMLTFVIRTQAPAMKKSLDERMGPEGAIIKVYTVETKRVREPDPVVKALAAAFVPKNINEKLQTGFKLANSTPIFWRVEGRK